VLSDGTRLDVTRAGDQGQRAGREGSVRPGSRVPLKQLVALDVLQGPGGLPLGPEAEEGGRAGFLGDGWPWVADRTVSRQRSACSPRRRIDFRTRASARTPRRYYTYDLAKYTRFEASVGRTPPDRQRGRAAVRVLLDARRSICPR